MWAPEIEMFADVTFIKILTFGPQKLNIGNEQSNSVLAAEVVF